MLTIKLKNVGKKHDRSFRLIVQEKRSKVDGKFVEDLGWYNPKLDKFAIKDERLLYWLGVGAKPTATVSQIIKKSKIALQNTPARGEARQGRQGKTSSPAFH